MPIQDGDLIMIQRGSNTYKVNAIEYTDKALSDDLILVNRGSNSYKMPYSRVDNANSSDWVLVERGGVSYKASMEDLRDVLGQPISFLVQVTGGGQRGQDSPGCTRIRYYTRYGARLTAVVTAKTTDVYGWTGSSTGDDVQGRTYSSFMINNEWILVAGNCGNMGVTYFRGLNCNRIEASGNAPTVLAGVGTNTPENQKNNIYTVYGSGYAVLTGGGGAGCQGGTTGGNGIGGGGGFSQTRPRAENTGTDTWNDITVSNPLVARWNSLTPNFSITYNGITKEFAGNETGKLRELLSW